MSSDRRIDAYIAVQAEFARPILVWWRERVRSVCPDGVETIKWGRPFFLYRDRPVAFAAAFKRHASLGFWRRDQNPSGREDEALGQFGRITALADLPTAEAFEALLRAEIALIDAGAPTKRPAAAKPELAVPPELAAALAGDAAAAATFSGFSTSCRRDYCEWIGEAKRPETRARRTAEAIGWLREGKRRNWRYETG